MTKAPFAKGKVKARTWSARDASSPPASKYFATPDPNMFEAFDYNPADGQYNLNPRLVPKEDVPLFFSATHGAGGDRNK
jgi:hypothetical protein